VRGRPTQIERHQSVPASDHDSLSHSREVDSLAHALPDFLEPRPGFGAVNHAPQKAQLLGYIVAVSPNVVLGDLGVEGKKTVQLDVLIRLAKARLAGQPLDPESIPEYRQEKKLKAFGKLIEGKLAPETWLSIFPLKREVWLKGGPALTATVLTERWVRLVLGIDLGMRRGRALPRPCEKA
jgi:hypothetical protein